MTACFAAGVDVAAEWGSDLKDGYCTESLRLNKNFCCANITSSVHDLNDDNKCDKWNSWSQAIRIHDESDAKMFDFFAYVVVAVCIDLLF